MNILLGEIVLWLASILPQEAFMPDSFPQIVQSRAERLSKMGLVYVITEISIADRMRMLYQWLWIGLWAAPKHYPLATVSHYEVFI